MPSLYQELFNCWKYDVTEKDKVPTLRINICGINESMDEWSFVIIIAVLLKSFLHPLVFNKHKFI